MTPDEDIKSVMSSTGEAAEKRGGCTNLVEIQYFIMAMM